MIGVETTLKSRSHTNRDFKNLYDLETKTD